MALEELCLIRTRLFWPGGQICHHMYLFSCRKWYYSFPWYSFKKLHTFPKFSAKSCISEVNIEKKVILNWVGLAGRCLADIPFCSIFTYFQYSLIHDLAIWSLCGLLPISSDVLRASISPWRPPISFSLWIPSDLRNSINSRSCLRDTPKCFDAMINVINRMSLIYT